MTDPQSRPVPGPPRPGPGPVPAVPGPGLSTPAATAPAAVPGPALTAPAAVPGPAPVPGTVPDGTSTTGSTGDPRVDAAMARLDHLDELPVADHVGEYDAVHRALQDALTAIDES